MHRDGPAKSEGWIANTLGVVFLTCLVVLFIFLFAGAIQEAVQREDETRIIETCAVASDPDRCMQLMQTVRR